MKACALVVALALFSTPAAAQSREWNEKLVHAAIAAGIAAHAADLSTTSWALGRVGDRYKESNRALQWAADDPVQLAMAKVALAAGTTYSLVRLHRDHPKLALGAAIVQTVVVSYVAHRNASVLGLR